MPFQAIFKRYELKYLLTKEQKEKVLEKISPYMGIDRYGRSEIRNIYYDTEDFLLIRRSIEKPVYKEKLRVRSYGQASESSTVFVELKKKYKSVVYKRRIAMTEAEAAAFLAGSSPPPKKSQISEEIDYARRFYKTLRPAAFLSYEREAFFARDGSDFRITFDDRILARDSDLSLSSDMGGVALLPEGMTLMEIKCSGGIPLWMCEILSGEKIYKTSFSKYGTAYREIIYPNLHKKQNTNTENKENILYV